MTAGRKLKVKVGVTEQIPENCAILVVDIEERYLQDREDYPISTTECLGIKKEMDILTQNIENLKTSIPCFTVASHALYQPFSELNLFHLGNWQGENTVLSPNVIATLESFPCVLVCGLWRERCVFTVAKHLNVSGINASILDREGYVISVALIGQHHDLDETAKWCNVDLNYLEEEQ